MYENIIHALNWRYATKKFDNAKRVPDHDIEAIKEILQLSASSFGIQPWKFMIVSDKAVQEDLVQYSFGQHQVAEASDVIVFCRPNDINDELVDEYISDYASKSGQSKDDLSGYAGMIKGFLGGMSKTEKHYWAEKQIYLALGNLMTCLGLMKIDACPMEGFNAKDYNSILGLDERDLSSVVILPIGYRHPDDSYASAPKIRYNRNELFISK